MSYWFEGYWFQGYWFEGYWFSDISNVPLCGTISYGTELRLAPADVNELSALLSRSNELSLEVEVQSCP